MKKLKSWALTPRSIIFCLRKSGSTPYERMLQRHAGRWKERKLTMKTEKSKSLRVKSADAAADIALINQYAVKELQPEDVFCFSVVLCDNENDRDHERFTDASLARLAELFVGKTGISDHAWEAERQIARIYRCEVETGGKTKDGRELKQLVGSAYMIRTERTQPIIDAIEGGIMKEVSVGCAIGKSSCSICGASMQWFGCENGHEKGAEYDGAMCVGLLEDPVDAYEFSFVAVPAQPGAGVKKALDKSVFEALKTADLSKYAKEIAELLPKFQAALVKSAEMEQREAILAENEKFLKG